MRFSSDAAWALGLLLTVDLSCDAFVPAPKVPFMGAKMYSQPVDGQIGLKMSMSEELGIPCDDECALESYPNMPASVHPGVLSGQSLKDLIQHAKTNGEENCKRVGELPFHCSPAKVALPLVTITVVSAILFLSCSPYWV